MGKLIATTQATIDGVIDPVGWSTRWRSTSGPTPSPAISSGTPPCSKGLIDEYEVYLNPLVWGVGNVHVLGDRGTVRVELQDVKRFSSGVVLLTYLPAS